MSNQPHNHTLFLLLIFASTLFLAANMIGLKIYTQLSANQISSLRSVKDQVAQNNEMISHRALWMKRRQQLEAHPVPELDPSNASAVFLESLQQIASEKKVKILEQSFGTSAHIKGFDTVSIHLKTSGSMEAIARWLFTIQAEGQYRALPELTLRSDLEPPTVLCDLQVIQYFIPKPNSP